MNNTKLLIVAWICAAACDGAEETNRKKRLCKHLEWRKYVFIRLLVSVFQIVKFANEQCDAGARHGTCYTEQVRRRIKLSILQQSARNVKAKVARMEDHVHQDLVYVALVSRIIYD